MINDGMLGDIRVGKLQQTNYAVRVDVPQDHVLLQFQNYFKYIH